MSNAHNKDGKYRGIIDEIREQQRKMKDMTWNCLLYTSDAADE